MSNLVSPYQEFSHQDFGTIRSLLKNGQPWFVAADVCKALEISNPTMALSRLDSDEKMTLSSNESHTGKRGGAQWYNIVSEPGLYTLILGSRKPEAKAFRRWITHDVIPAIRKTGGYVADSEAFVQNYLPFADESIKNLFRSTLAVIEQQNRKMREDAPKVLFADSVSSSDDDISVGELAKILAQHGVDFGRNRLFYQLRKDGFLMNHYGEGYNTPTQKSVRMGIMRLQETAITRPDGKVILQKTTKVTGRGQLYFTRRYALQEKEGRARACKVLRREALAWTS